MLFEYGVMLHDLEVERIVTGERPAEEARSCCRRWAARPGARPSPGLRRPPARYRRYDLEHQVVGRGGEVHEQVLDLVEHLLGAGVGPVDLVEHHHRRQVTGQRLGQHVAGLGQQPSAASTRGRTPSTMARPRSTSPPKSAWPEVSTRLIFTCLASGQVIEAALARMVTPRSRSWSLESMARSTRPRLVGVEHARGAEHGVHQRGLAVVDVGDGRET